MITFPAPARRLSDCLLLSLALAAGGLGAAEPSAVPAGPPLFITRSGDRLFEGPQEFRYVSVNLPDVLQIISNYRFDGDTAVTRYRLPDAFEQRDAIRTVRQLGGRVVRTFVITCRDSDDPMAMFNVASLPVRAHEPALVALDRLLQISREEGVRLLIPLVAYRSAVRGDPSTYGPDFWVVGSEANRKFKDMLAQLLGRTNSLTGVPYRDDPTVFGWQTGNELVIGDDPDRRAWLHDIAAYIKQLAPRQLLIDGRNKPNDVYDRYTEFLDDANLDAVSYHTYVNLPQADTPDGTLRLIRGQLRGHKPLIVSEIAMYTSPAALRRLLDEIVADGTVGANWWGLRFHNRDGGFYKHSDKNSEFEDLNWPGFARETGLPAEIDTERELLGILTEYAGRITDRKVAAPERPAAPRLLPVPDPGHLSWQGSTGADRYTVQRAEAADGPWADLAVDLPDNLIAYAAQYCDRTAQAGRPYYYRVLAANASGRSAPSNVVGPVVAQQAWLVDELFDLQLAAPASRNLRIDRAYAYTSRLEDIAVALRADPAQPAELVYRLPQPIRIFTATVYDAEVAPRLYALDPSGDRHEIQPEIASYDGGRRRRLTARLDGPATGLVLAISAQAAAGQAVGRVEIATTVAP